MLAELRDGVRRCCIHIALAAAAAFVASIGLIMLVVGAHLHLAAQMPAPAAAAVTGGALLILAGLIALIARRFGRSTSRKPAAGVASPKNGAMDIAGLAIAAEAAITADARSPTPRLALVAVLVGCAIGASPRLRRAIADLAR